ncbi:hypothetical protein Tco_0330826, partial [Tanacetum coccineum]
MLAVISSEILVQCLCCYTPYPCAKDLWAVIKTNSRGVYDIDEDVSEVATDENNVDRDQFFQENERVICTTSANNDIQPFNLVHGDIEEVANDLDDNTNDDDVEEDELKDIASDENDDAELIYEEDEFADQTAIGRTITEILHFRYIEPWPAWGAVPQDKKDQMWLHFKKKEIKGPMGSTKFYTYTHILKAIRPPLVKQLRGSAYVDGSFGEGESNGLGGLNEVGGSDGTDGSNGRGITHGAGTSSDPIFMLIGIPSTPHAATSNPPDA